MLTEDGCRVRQERFRRAMERHDIDAAIISDPREIYYLTGLLIERFPALLYIETEDSCWLVSHTMEGEALVDHRDFYEPSLMATLNPDPMRLLAYAVARKASGRRAVHRLGWQAESLSKLLADVFASAALPDEWVAIDDDFSKLERVKEPDEVELLRRSIDCSLAAYAAAGAAIAPGVSELAVLEAGHEAATLKAGQTIFHSGDYQSGQIGGFARDRAIAAGELYIIDAWSTYCGYWSDLCRTFPVGEMTPLQREVHEHIAAIQAEVPSRLQPGMRGTELWQWMDKLVREHPALREAGLIHHAGHAIGLRAHEMPDLNRDREGILEPGNVICVEPGGYAPELRAGVRIENTYLITENGADLLSNYPTGLS